MMIAGTKESKTVGEANLVFDLSRRTVGHVKEVEILGFRMAGAACHNG